MARETRVYLSFLCSISLVLGCTTVQDNPESDSGSDTDADADTDTNSGSDTDADTDAGSGSDTDADSYILDQAAMPLIGIFNTRYEEDLPDADDIPHIAQTYTRLHVDGGVNFMNYGHVYQELLANNPNLIIVPYFQSTLSAYYGVTPMDVERDPLGLMAMYFEGTIDRELDPGTTKFKVIPQDTERGFGLKATTANGDISTSITEYIIVIRIGNEIMKVVSVDPSTYSITVERAYAGTSATVHPIKSKVFAPVYRGKRSEDQGWGATSNYPDNATYGNNPPEYHLRLDSEATGNKLAEAGSKFISKGANGLWLDLTDPNIFIPCNAYGFYVDPWNFQTDKEYTSETYIEGQKLKCHNLRTAIHKETGVNPYLVANNHANGNYFPTKGNGVALVTASENYTPVDALTLEAPFSYFKLGAWFDEDHWKENVSTIIHACAHGNTVWPWLKQIEYNQYPFEANDGKDPQLMERYQLFDYASVLMGYSPTDGFAIPLPLYRTDANGVRSLNLPEYFFYNIGEPVDTVDYDRVDDMRITDKTYMRKWSKAIILVNPTFIDDTDVALPDGYMDPDTMKEITHISIPQHTAKILLKM